MIPFLEKRLTQLERAGISEEIVAHIRSHIEQGEPLGLVFISPYRLADDWNLSQHDVLEAFLYGARLGIFDLMWHIRCPFCQAFTEPVIHLALLKSQTHCEYCQNDFRAGFDDAVEVTFEVNKELRESDQEKWLKTQEVTQKLDVLKWKALITYWDWFETTMPLTVDAESTWVREFSVDVGTYYVHSSDSFWLWVPITIQGKPAESVQHVHLLFDGGQLTRKGAKVYRPGVLRVHIANTSLRAATLNFSQHKPYPWTSAAQLASNQVFRELFFTEVLATDETFLIQHAVFAFVDIQDSTSLYGRLGDFEAYGLVKEYLKVLTQTIQAHHGAVVKTNGDAVMATFMTPEDAIKALFEIQKVFDEFNALGGNGQDELIIKIGAHCGPCLVVAANDQLDYFGRTVNIAAGVKELSTGKDIVLTETFYKDAPVQACIEESGWQIHCLQATLRGTGDFYDIVQVEKTP